MNEHEKTDIERIVTLELMQSQKHLLDAHSKLLMGHYSEAKEILTQVWDQIRDVSNLIPEEPGE